ncbi:MAG TPA: flagellar filament capping protein FliD [Nocardioidaceae bacterium]
MANASIGGLVSGLDTATIISQLMQIEAQPQTNLKNRLSDYQKQVNSLQTVNSKLAGIATKAAALSQLSSWTPTKASSTDDAVTVTADAGATPSSLTLNVVGSATASRATYTTSGTADQVLVANTNVTVTFANGDTPYTFNTGDGTLSTIADKLNASGSVKATLVKSGTNAAGEATYRLTVESADTGASSGFIIDDGSGAFLGGPASHVDGVDAQITVNGQSLTSSSNTFTDLMPGVDVTVSAAAVGKDVTITVARDAQSLSDKVKSLVDSVNAALDDIDSLTAYKSDSSAPGILSGDSTLRQIRDQLISSVTSGVNGQSLASVGIQTDKTGHLVFDESKFQDAFNADPTGTAKLFAGTATFSGTGSVDLHSSTWRTQEGKYVVDAAAQTIDGAGSMTGSLLSGATGSRVDGLVLDVSADANGTVTYTQGFAAKLEAITQRASDSAVGTVTAVINGRNDSIDRLEDDIADWDVRLGKREETLRRQYTALEVALGKLQDQSTWLAGQISSLPSISTGK